VVDLKLLAGEALMTGKSKSKNGVSSPISIFCPQCGTEINPFGSVPDKPLRRGPTDERFQEIARCLKDLIYEGSWKPGTRIPTRRQLCQKYGASPITIQNIIDQFEEDGFLRTERPSGTYVAVKPPHTFNVALVFPEKKESSLLWKALSTVAEKDRDDGLKILQFTSIKFNGWTGNAEQVALVEYVKRKKLMGIFFTSPPFLVERTPIVTEPGIPRCAFTLPGASYPEISKFSVDGTSFQTRSLEYLSKRGRKKVSVIGHPWILNPSHNWLKKIDEYGLKSGPHWLQGMNISEPAPSENIARLIFSDICSEHPDGLIITDDNLVESVTRGIAQAGVRIPSDLEIVAHTNFPCPPKASVPVVRLGYDAKEILETGLRLLREKRSAGTVSPAAALIKAVFEDELK